MPKSLGEVVRAEIAARGPMPYHRFVELALYHPSLGFYVTSGAGRRRDFITSVEVGPLFGAVVARAIDEVWLGLGSPASFSVVEAGAGRGTLARTVMAARPACVAALDYHTVEISEAQRGEHPLSLQSHGIMPVLGGTGMVVANELLDNLPFDLWEYLEGEWHEVRVDVVAGRLVERLVPGDPPAWIAAMSVSPGDGRVRVVDHVAAGAWLRQAFATHAHGVVMVFDYTVAGYPVVGDRQWLRTYRDHGRGIDPLDEPGSQDITVDVAIDQVAAVRRPDRVTAQADWLRAHGIEELVDEGRRIWREGVAAPDLAAFAAQSRIGEAAALLDPAGLGSFTVLEWDV